MLALDRAASMNFAMVAELRGPLSLRQVRRAVAAVARQHPLFGAKVRGGQFVHAGPPEVSQVIGRRPRLWPTVVAEVDARFDPSVALARVKYMRHAPDHTSLIVVFHHAIGDATCGAWLIHHLLKALAAAPRVQGGWPPAVEDMVPKRARGLGGLFRHLGFLWRLWKATRAVGPLSTVPVLRRAPPGERSTRILARQLSVEQTEALTQAARKAGTTAHGALAAGLLLTLRRVNAVDHGVVLGSPVDLRASLSPDPKDAVGLYVTLAASTHRLTVDSAFWDVARDARKQLGVAIERGDAMVGVPYHLRLVGHLVRLLGDKGAGLALRLWRPGVGLSNIGAVKVPTTLGPIAVRQVAFGASVAALADLTVCATTHAGRLNFTVCATAPAVSEAMLAAVADELRDRLAALPPVRN